MDFWKPEYWGIVVGIFYALDKIVKMTPSKKDDFIVDVVFKVVKFLFQPKTKKSNKKK